MKDIKEAVRLIQDTIDDIAESIGDPEDEELAKIMEHLDNIYAEIDNFEFEYKMYKEGKEEERAAKRAQQQAGDAYAYYGLHQGELLEERNVIL